MPRKREQKNRSRGQAVLEYVFVTLLMFGIFASVFRIIHRSLLRLWICDLTTQVSGPTGCANPDLCAKYTEDANLRQALSGDICN